MKLLLRSALVLLLALAALPAAAQNLTLTGTDGSQLREADLAQGATVVVVWASWSPRGRDIDARVRSIASRWGSQARVVTVNFQEDDATVRQFLQDKPMNVPVYLDRDGAFAKKYAVTNLPGLVVFKDGGAVYRNRLPDDPDSVLGSIFQ
jgi:thiol-disulfide isomerase/thioredoxin